MQHLALVGLAIGLVSSAVACGPPPSLRARWSVVDRDGNVDATTAAQVCSELGINTVRVRIVDEAGDVVDEEHHACFARRFDDAEQTVAGPALDAGLYTVEVRGVQRNLEPWPVEAFAAVPQECDADLDEGRCDPKGTGPCECSVFEARDDHTERLVDFRLAAPGECYDGIDNDQDEDGAKNPDGLIDAEDPSCSLLDVPRTESRPVTKVQFQLTMSLFGGNDVVTCGAVRLVDVRARLCPLDDGAAPAPCVDVPDTAVLGCRTGAPLFFEAILEQQQDYTLELVGRGPQGAILTAPKLFPVSFGGGPGAVVPIEVDFAASAFEPPIEAPAGFLLEYEHGDNPRGCKASRITTVAVEILDAHGGPLATPVTLDDGTPLDGTAIGCSDERRLTEPLAWGGYSLRASAMTADGAVCYSTDGTGPGGADAPLVLSPTDIPIVLPAVLDATGNPPTGCN